MISLEAQNQTIPARFREALSAIQNYKQDFLPPGAWGRSLLKYGVWAWNKIKS